MAITDYYGGQGGSFGGSGYSGGGGGGGGASIIAVNTLLQAIAAGGGGGGGGGQYSAGQPNNNTPGTAGTTYGGYGQGKGGGDGAGAGGGGGGANFNSTVVSPDIPVYRTTDPAYNNFLNSYGVWTNPSFIAPVNVWQIVNYTIDLPGEDNYYFVVSANNAINLLINNNLIVSNTDYRTTRTSGLQLFGFGPLVINLQAINYGAASTPGPALFAAAMYQSSTNNMIWNTRQTTGPGGGGLGGLVRGGDSGAYSGENGNTLAPTDSMISVGSNGGAPNTTGGAGSITISYYS